MLIQGAYNWCVLAVIAIGVTALLAWAALYLVQSLAFHGNYGAQSPAAVFQEAMGKPVPDGLTGLRVSGRKYATRSWVWMRFRATEGAMKKILTNDDKYTVYGVPMVLGGTMWVGNPRYNSVDLKAAGWQDIRHIETPIIYTVNRPPTDTSSVWVGNIIADPETHLVYVELMCG